MARGNRRLRVLVLSRNYPNNVMELLGLWVRSSTRQVATFCDVKVVSPVPYCPPLPGMPDNYSRFRRIERRSQDGAIESLHPRFLLGPGYTTHTIEWLSYLASVRPTVDRLRREFPFDLIHAHFTYPDGVVAVHLGRRYGVPVVITEQNPWGPWMDKYASVRRRAIQASKQSACHIAISELVRRTIRQYAGTTENVTVIPDGVDGSLFTLPSSGLPRERDQILFAGAIRPVKGVDVLLQAMRHFADQNRRATLVLVGEAFYTAYKQEEVRLKQLTRDLGLADRVTFAGKQPLPELVRLMQHSAVLVLPSRYESLGMVLIEALACGTPVVATRCGGPEEIVNDRVGVLVPPEDPEALARGIAHVLGHARDYDPVALRTYALDRFGLELVGERLREVYEDAVHRHAPARRSADKRIDAPVAESAGESCWR